MTSTIKVDNIQNQCGANIINESSDTITIGASGDTVALASGASQSGFGRTGTVDWDTSSIKTANFTAASGNGYFCNTTGGAFEVDLPAGTAGAIVAFKDYAGTWDTNNLSIDPNGSEKIGGGTAGETTIISTEGASVTLVYVDAAQGWVVVNDATQNVTGMTAAYIAATGGTITTVCTNYKVHTFTGPGTFEVTCAGNAKGSNKVSYMVIAGGGGGGKSSNGGCRYGGGGGGSGGYRESKAPFCSYTASPTASTCGLPVSAESYAITVGAGGPVGPGSGGIPGGQGSNSIFSTITAAGGGGGTSDEGNSCAPNKNGGSGGGGSALSGANPAGNAGGDGNSPPVSPSQGTPGYSGSPTTAGAGGGGGAGGPSAKTPFAVTGKNGATSSINATPTVRAGGGGGGSASGGPNSGGTGGGGGSGIPAVAGSTNTGGGGGGSDHNPPSSQSGAGGGSGIVIIRYRFQ